MALRLALVLLVLCMAHATTGENASEFQDWGVAHIAGGEGEPRGCSDGECLNDEMANLEAEIDRRLLYADGVKFISYGALKRNNVPCGQRGASYYNCNTRSQVNPYRRQCTVITQCARDLH